MGNKLKQSGIFSKNAMSQIGTVTVCPNCQQKFPPTTTYQHFDQHVTQCLQNFRPSDQERLKMQRRKKSKDSIQSKGSSQDDNDNHDYITIQVYVKKFDYQEKPNINRKQLKDNKIKASLGNGKQNQKRQIVFQAVNKHSYKWIKSHLTYSQTLIGDMKLDEISKQGTAYKILWLHQKLANLRISWKQGCEQLIFNPESIVKDSLILTNLNMFKELKITVLNDVVHDAGGLLREWATMLLSSLINQFRLFVRNKQGYYVLNSQLLDKLDQKIQFSIKNNKNINLKEQQIIQKRKKERIMNFHDYDMTQQQIEEILKNSQQIDGLQIFDEFNDGVTYNNLYQLFGCLLAKIVIQKVTIPSYFDWMFLENILNQKSRKKVAANQNKNKTNNSNNTNTNTSITGNMGDSEIDLQCLDRLYSYDKQLHNSLDYLVKLLQKLRKQQQTTKGQHHQQLQSLCLNFTVSNTKKCQQLINHGKDKLVSNAKQLQMYISKILYFYEKQMFKQPISIIKHAFYRVIKKQIFDGLLYPDQFQLLINGVDGTNINVEDWKNGTQYKQPYHAEHKVIKYFWTTVNKMTPYQKMRLLKFVTGSQRLPVYGFKNLQTNRGETSCFTIEPVKYDKKNSHFPKAHTCFNRLVLPMYSNENILAQALMAVIRADFDGVWGME